jgi:hypothetical protein
MDLDENGIATCYAKEDKKQRKQFIIDFYGKWIVANPTKHIYNKSLEAFIEVRFLSLEETAGHASTSYKSTVAVTFLPLCSTVMVTVFVPAVDESNVIIPELTVTDALVPSL